MKKNILALTLVAVLSMLGACSSDNNAGGANGSGDPGGPGSTDVVVGNFSKEPIKGAKLEIWKLGEVGVEGKLPLDDDVTTATGAFKFNVVPNEIYVVKVAPNGLADAKVMNVDGGTDINGYTFPTGLEIDANTAIIVPANSPALLNPIGILATQASGIPTSGALTKEEIVNASALVSGAINTIITNLSALTLLAGNNVTIQTLGSADWSANQEFAFQLATRFDAAPNRFALSDLADTLKLTLDPLPADIIADALASANAVAKTTGQKEVTPEDVNENEIIRTIFFNHDNTLELPAQINASNATVYSLNITAQGVNARVNLKLVQHAYKDGDEALLDLIPASSVEASTISPTSAGITVMTKAGRPANAFGYDITDLASGTHELIIRADYILNSIKTSTQNTIVLNLSDKPGDDDWTSDLQP